MVNTLKGFRKWRSLKGSDMAALIGKRSSVMGKFWDGCSKDDEDKLYPCVIKEYDDRKKIARIAALQQMVRVEMIDDAAVYNEEEGLWIALTMMSEYHAAHLAANPPAPAPVEEDSQATEDEPEAGEEAPVPLTKEEVRQKKALAASRKASGFRVCFTAPQLVKYVTENNGKSLLAVNKWTCLDNFTAGDPPCGRMLIDERARRRGGSAATSRCHPEQYKMMLRSGETKAGGKTIVSADGSLITRLKFEDAFNYHVDWVSMCYTDAVPFHRAKTPGTRRFAASLRPGYVPPTRDTSIKVLALDMMTSCGVAYVTLNLSFVDDEKSGFVHKNVQLAYEEFPEGPHTGKNIATWIANTLALHGIDIENVGAPTIDGAANGKRAMKILKLAFRICAFHQGMRCVHYAPAAALKAMFKVFKKLALYTTKESTKFNEAMKAAQRACGIRAIEIEPALRMTLKKTHADLRGDEIIDGELDEAAVEETASIVSSDDEDSSSSDDDDDERPKLSKKKAMDEAKLMKRTPTPAQWNLARQMLPVLLKVKEFNKLVQYSTVPTTDRTLPMARQLLRSSRRSPGPCTWKKNSDGVYSKTFVQIESRICSRRSPTCSAAAPPATPPKAATQLYSALYFETSARIGRQAGEKTKLSEVESNRTKRSKGEKSLLDQAFDDLDGSSDDDASMDVDACEMTWLDELRSTPKKERKDRFEFKAGLDGEKHFSALQFYSKLRMRAPVHAAMAQQIFADEATGPCRAVVLDPQPYTSKLRKALQGKVIAPMLRCKANHDLFFEEIKAKIYERYFRKYRNNVDAFPDCVPGSKDDADDDVAN
ncbi:hypothetical protein JL722_14823 [Aureococcus anophagefferens]|nr:hypothetical protein JL722_14823 [Aureococcus anophagefferens]